ncbi:MAG TPA: glycosyltransferase [Burkholderiales bacterium]|nr:glycosyltransferase [Burkholderiales bacterium]
MLKVLVVGKYHSIIHWTENNVEAFRQSGCDTDYFAINGGTAAQSLYFKCYGKIRRDKSAIICDSLAKKLKQFKPDLIVFIVIAALKMPENLFALSNEICPNAKKIAWIGDKLNAEESLFANYIDWVFCTDSAFIEDLRSFGYTVSTSYLPLAVNQRIFRPLPVTRSNKMVYVANNSPERGRMMRRIHKPVTLYGKGWSALKDTPHDINAYRLPYKKLPYIYAGCAAVLNVKNEKNVVHGLNQRSFEPYGCMTPVLNDDMADIDRCFDVGKEILVYRSVEELNDYYDRLLSDPAFALSIGTAGYKRVLAEHTYQHRIACMLTTVGLK